MTQTPPTPRRGSERRQRLAGWAIHSSPRVSLIARANSGPGELKSRIFQPLHLRSTTFPTKPGLQAPYAHGYYVPGKPPAIDISGLSPSLSPASGAIVSTVVDVADFYRALLSGHLLKPELLRRMQQTVSQGRQVDIPGQRYGLGLERFPTSCGIVWGHNGDVAGYFSFAFTSTDGARQAVLMVNEDAGSLPKPAAAQFLKLIDSAYCSTA